MQEEKGNTEIIKIKTYKTERVEVSETPFLIPSEPYYGFETGVRRSIRIIPIYTTWLINQGKEREVIYELQVTCIYQSSECKVEKFSIRLSDIEKIYNGSNPNMVKTFVHALFDEWFDKRTKEQFEADLNCVIEELKNL